MNEICSITVKLGFGDPKITDFDSTVQEANMSYPSDASLMKKLAQKCAKVMETLKEGAGEQSANFSIDLKSIITKARSYFFLAKNTAKDLKERYFADLFTSAKKEVYKTLIVLETLPQDHLKTLPWNIKNDINHIQSHGRRYLLDVAHFIRTHSIKAGKRLAHHLEQVSCIVKYKSGKNCEFGRVFQIGRIAGNFVFTGSHTDTRRNDKSALIQLLQTHQELFETKIDC